MRGGQRRGEQGAAGRLLRSEKTAACSHFSVHPDNFTGFHTSHTFLLPLLQTMAEREALEQEAQQQEENEKKRLQERKVGGSCSAAW